MRKRCETLNVLCSLTYAKRATKLLLDLCKKGYKTAAKLLLNLCKKGHKIGLMLYAERVMVGTAEIE